MAKNLPKTVAFLRNAIEADTDACRADNRAQQVIALDYGVTQTVISDVKRGVSWRHVA